jgi:hypothetical protein
MHQLYHLRSTELRASSEINQSFKTTIFLNDLRKSEINEHWLFKTVTIANIIGFNIVVNDVNRVHLSKHCF